MVRVELYDDIETRKSREILEIISEEIDTPVVLLGGWAVYLTVNENFEKEYGSTYLGSKDLDLGFHIDKSQTIDELNASDFSKTLKVLEKVGFWPHGTSRYCKIFHFETGGLITEDESRRYPPYDLFYLYVDMIVDNIHPLNNEVFKIKPIDEPLLSRAFNDNLFNRIKYGESTILLPEPHILLATKLSSFPRRTKDEKKIKDACDIYALLWSSPLDISKLVELTKKNFYDLCSNASEIIMESYAEQASKHLGIELDEFINVVKKLIE
jgi:hypothetical protein